MTNNPWRWVGLLAVAGALPCAVMTVLAGRAMTDVQDVVFGLLVVGWGTAPYLTAYACARTTLPAEWAVPTACGIVLYAAIDWTTHWQALWRPSGSADALGVLFLPVWSPIATGGVAIVVRAITAIVRRPRSSVCEHRTPESLSDVR